MNEKTAMSEAFESIRNAWSTHEISWELAGEIFGAVALALLLLFVLREAKKFKGKLNDNE